MSAESALPLIFDRVELIRAACPGTLHGAPYELYGFRTMLIDCLGRREGFYAYRRMLGLPAESELVPMPLRSLRDHALERGFFYVESEPSGVPFVTPRPTAIGALAAFDLHGTSRSAYLTCLIDARVSGRSGGIAVDDCIVHDFEPHELALSQMAFDVDFAFFARTDDTVWTIRTPQQRELPEAFGALVGALTYHFGDWFAWYVTKYLMALEAGLSPDVPVLVDAGMPARNLEVLHCLTDGRCRTIAIEPNETVLVRKLWYAPEVCGGATERLDPAIHRMRRAVEALRPHAIERVFLARSASYPRHRLVNGGAVEEIARKHGFTVIHAETLSFEEQIRTLKGARFVVGPEGTALFLNLFARRGTKLCVLTSPFIEPLATDVKIYESIGIDVTLMTGPREVAAGDDTPPSLYDDFSIDERGFEQFLVGWLGI